MYLPPHFEVSDLSAIHQAMEAVGLANLVTWNGTELLSTPLPLILVRDEGEFGTLYGHLAKANPQASAPVVGEALALFSGVDAYITPSWYATKQETGKVVPTWNYETIHAYGMPEFFQDEVRLLDLVTLLTQHHEGKIGGEWQVSDAPDDFIRGQLRAIVGFRMAITRLQGKRKMSQNRPLADREGVAAGLRERGRDDVADYIPLSK
ncbi:FMN-binding negative transcriptional regulator [Terriglobus sp. TAA 43]|uniref:FMN-binding negative transcriptional regulator n=1 Tax=Terriglobus sp. TAA 43 TaxID=278961 RepID=UPI0006455371|nr:FMN-binding negative transcriptional regulator [Terriglobus sp. TAA 43]